MKIKESYVFGAFSILLLIIVHFCIKIMAKIEIYQGCN
jgi:hypothetical protein